MPRVHNISKDARDLLEKTILENRPQLSPNSVKSYVSLLSNMYYKAHDKDAELKLSWFRDDSNILDALKDKPPSVRKTYLASVIVLNGAGDHNTKLSSVMSKDQDDTVAEYNKQEKTAKQTANWMDYDEIKNIHSKFESEALPVLNSKTLEISEAIRKMLNRYMLLTLSCGIYFPPRRSDICDIKLRDYDTEKDNYIDMKKNKMVYNKYKTAKKYGREEVSIPPVFKKILSKYIKKLPDQEYLLMKQNGTKFSPQNITRELNGIFGKNISTSMLRHIYLSNLYKDVPKLNDMLRTAEEMGHSVGEAMKYVKR